MEVTHNVEYIERGPSRRFSLSYVVAGLLLLVLASRTLAGLFLDYQWWKELGQVPTWVAQLWYGVAPVVVAGLVALVVLWLSHAGAVRAAGTRLGLPRGYARVATLALVVVAALLAMATIDSWTVVRYVGSLGEDSGANAWQDPVFGKPLGFYFFQLPLFRMLLRYVIGLALLAGVLHWVVGRFWRLKQTLPSWSAGEGIDLDLKDLELTRAFDSRFVRTAGAVVFLGLAVSYFLDRYDLLFENHGSLVGVDWVAENVKIPLLWGVIGAALVSAAALAAGRAKLVIVFVLALILPAVVPSLVHAIHVRPSEITVQKPYIERHIAATRSAYALAQHVKEVEFDARLEAPIDLKKHKPLLDNVRLWDWRAFHDTVTQIQALRPYYVFHDTDVDRYQINGQIRQILLTPRELDVQQLPADARGRWINPHFIYTHGYGIVAAEAARITPDGLPALLVQDAPPTVKTDALKLNRPEIYYGEVTHDPVFVRTKQAEFNYPSGSGNVETRYDGKGGFPISGLGTRVAAALGTGNWNILLTSYLEPESRMMIRRKVGERVRELAGFLMWDRDPYLVVTPAGRLVWILDGYTTSSSHPYSQSLTLASGERMNYIRNSVKATVDAYDGTTTLYVFDAEDPILRAYRRLFPALLKPQSEMPADLRAHTRYPETIFRVQAEIYRTYHMTNPEAFFNKEDMWDLARGQGGAGTRAEAVTPTYLVATLPGSEVPEFLLMTSFTPRNKDNLIGLLVARCDGEHLGELVSLQLSKQALIFGPMQVEAIINQDQTISKDLTLWNQQGSQVLRGQMLVLPVENTLLYIEPIYIQASEARMPQLKKVVLAMGKRLVYSDTYEQALADLTGQSAPAGTPAVVGGTGAKAEPGGAPTMTGDVLGEVRKRFQRYRELNGQGRFSEAGREMEEIEKLLKK